MKKLILIFLLIACFTNADEWRKGRSSIVGTGYRQEEGAGKIQTTLYPPALWYEFNYNDGSIVYDLSGNNNTGTVSGATWTADATGGSFRFDGTNDCMSIPASSSLALGGTGYTISVWIKSNGTLTSQKDFAGIYHKGLVSENQNRYYILCTAGETLMSGFYDTESTGRNATTPTLTGFNGVWKHVVATFNGATDSIAIYVNGVLSTNVTGITQTFGTTAETTYIGNIDNSTTYTFKGDIDAVIVENHAITSNEVLRLYQRGR